MTDDEYIDELEREIALEDAAFLVPIHFREVEARRRQAAGEKPCVSTGIHGRLTYGYGMLDQFGFWQYPLPDGEDVK
jgi:hypothetical protein